MRMLISISVVYLNGQGVARDTKKAEHYFELGAIGGEQNQGTILV